MSDHDDRLPMHQMLEHARDGVELIRGRARAEIRTNRLLQLALAHVVLIVGEAATRVSAAGRARHSEIPWSKAIGEIDHDAVWDTIAEDFPALVAALERALSRESG